MGSIKALESEALHQERSIKMQVSRGQLPSAQALISSQIQSWEILAELEEVMESQEYWWLHHTLLVIPWLVPPPILDKRFLAWV